MTRQRINLWLAVLGVALWALQPASVDSGRLDPPLTDTLFTTGVTR